MRKAVFTVISVIGLLIFIHSCGNQPESEQSTVKIENTLKSISYFSDSANMDPQELKTALESFNAAIAEIGYPDAGYKSWIIQSDTSNIRFMVEGYWPSQEIYTQIHDDERYKAVNEATGSVLESLEWVEYHRFIKID